MPMSSKFDQVRIKTALRYPSGGVWPEEMAADMAAAFVDEVSVAAFLAKVGTVWPLPDRRKGSRKKRSRELLLKRVRELHGIAPASDESMGDVEDVAKLI